MSSYLDPIKSIKEEPMGFRQWRIVVICIGLLALDGYDVMAIAFAAPGMTAEWGLSKTALGIILPLELVGMALGSIFMGSFSDSHGRRPTILIGLVILTIGMAISGMAPNVYVLGAARVFTGIGIGGLLATATATSSDFCNDRNRSLAVVLVAGGFSFGIYLGATFLAPLLNQYDWRITFYLGVFFSLIFIPIVYFYVPETISFLIRSRPDNFLESVKSTLKSLGHSVPDAIPPVENQTKEPTGFSNLFKTGFLLVTIILSFAYFANIATYYYFVKWLPTIVSDVGYSASEAAEVLGIISLGGVFGSIGMSLVSRLVAIKPLMVITLILSAVGVGCFPYFVDTIQNMKLFGFITGLFLFAALSGFFALFSLSFPSSLLGSGSGLVLGIGRGGAVLGPMIPGFLFAANLSMSNVALIMCAGSLLAGIAVLFLTHTKYSAT